jgi:hypothetical protein
MPENEQATIAPTLAVARLGQAVFTSARTVRSNGYQLVGHSQDVDQRDCTELIRWGPSHDSLAAGASRSVNYFPLPSGAYCLSQTVAHGAEHSRRGGVRCYTHCLVCGTEDLEIVAYDPWLLFAAAERAGLFACWERVPQRLPTVELPLSTAVPQATCDAEVADDVQEALQHDRLAIWGVQDAEALVAGVLAAMSPAARRTCSFTTGLRHSPQRPFRLMCVEQDSRIFRRLARQGIHVLGPIKGVRPL